MQLIPLETQLTPFIALEQSSFVFNWESVQYFNLQTPEVIVIVSQKHYPSIP